MCEVKRINYKGVDYDLTEKQWNDCMKAAEYMKRAKANDFTEDELVDIKEVHIDTSKPELLRIADYILQVKNPYYSKVGNTKVRVSYTDTDRTVTDCFLEMLKWM